MFTVDVFLQKYPNCPISVLLNTLFQLCLPLMFSCRNTLIVLLELCLTVSLQTGHGGQSGVCRPGPTAVLPPADVLPVRPGRTPRLASSQPQLDALHALEQGQASHSTSPWLRGCLFVVFCVFRHHTYTLFHENVSTFFSNIIGLPECRNKRKTGTFPFVSTFRETDVIRKKRQNNLVEQGIVRTHCMSACLLVYLFVVFVYSGIIPSQNPWYVALVTWLFICCFLCIQASYLVRTHCMVSCLLGYLFVVFCVFRHHT